MSKDIKKGKIIVILGPTSSGKTRLGVGLALQFNGEIISADSRQVYKYMDIGTGKDLDEYKNIPYHLLDVVHPNTKFHLAKYQALAFKAIDDVLKRGRTPIIVGGSGLYLQAVVDNYNLSRIKPDTKLRNKLENKTAEKLFIELKKINLKFANKLNNSDKNNKRRLIRYIEIGQNEMYRDISVHRNYEFLLLGLAWPQEVLRERIYKRLIERLEKEGMIKEIKNLHEKKGVAWKRLESFGLEYKFVSGYLQGKFKYDEMVEKLNIAIRQFSKKQMSWFRRWEKQRRKIFWIKDKKEAENLIKKFLK